MARTWNAGKGGQCVQEPAEGVPAYQIVRCECHGIHTQQVHAMAELRGTFNNTLHIKCIGHSAANALRVCAHSDYTHK